MSGKRKTYSSLQKVSSVFMILALLWLTVSAPFVFADQQQSAKQDTTGNIASSFNDTNEEEAPNPFGNNTEEKAPSGSNSFSEEYLHDHHIADYFFSEISQYHKGENAGTYIAFHGELLVPPPNHV